ncbi:hypothetical protein H2198_004797 [Neophaeococcomyces mojaviensis]|uniref:Uncharacterized protein n=1 Tax=Neophaeococcomyces mojaviensis TaxID=3383035 RepID=A0ACC3A7M0_9EURO|nr:hypothetical protein H2198_004797 [Knufia sp. JES_112]
MNGHIAEKQRSVTPSSHLGKRKRSASPDKPQVNGNVGRNDANIDNIVREIKQYAHSPKDINAGQYTDPPRYDIALSLMSRSLPNRATDSHSTKKQKTDPEEDTIEVRLAYQHYTSVEQIVADFRQAISECTQDGWLTNGENDKSHSAELDKIEQILSDYSHDDNDTDKKSSPPLEGQAGDVLTLRSTVEGGGTKQLFTGLRIRPDKNVRSGEIDVRKLPNGLDIAEATPLNTIQSFTDKDSRTFGEVFRQIRNIRQLDQPKSSRGTRKTLLEFTSSVDSLTTCRKEDYRVASLSAGSWLDYSISEFDPAKPAHEPAKSTLDTQALFKSTFSSFAPSEDNTNAIISRTDRSRQWYRKHGSRAMGKIYSTSEDSFSRPIIEYPELEDDFTQLIEDFIPDEADAGFAWPQNLARGNEDDDVLEEISELVQTLSSYQRLRDLDKGRIDTNTKPTGPEMDIFEMLRNQLKVLVDSLPPFAVAKLDGDQLKDLNISTTILVPTVDFAGTGQPDEYTLRRTRITQAQQVPAQRPVSQVQPPTRNSYTTASTPTASYNNNARSYNSNVTTTPSLPGYAQRNQHIYNTPRPNVVAPGAYNQTPAYPRAQQPYPNATIQQFQRMQQNGYSSNAAGQQTPYNPQRSTQTPFQQQVQTNAMQFANRSNSPAQPITNGQTYPQQTPQPQQQVQRPYSGQGQQMHQTPYQQSTYAQVGPNATIQQAKAAVQMRQAQSQSQSPQPQAVQVPQQQQTQRQASGTPQPVPQRPTSALATAAAAGSMNNDVGLRGGDNIQQARSPSLQMQQQAAQTISAATAGA